MRRLLNSLVIVTGLITLFSCHSKLADVVEPPVMNTGKTYRVTGMGAYPKDSANNPVQSKLMAREAAMQDAYRQLLETLAGVQVKANVTVSDAITQSAETKTFVEGHIRGATIVAERNDAAKGIYEMDLELVCDHRFFDHILRAMR